MFYSSRGATKSDLAWSKSALGRGDGDDLLEAGEMFEITVGLSGVGETIGTYHTFTAEVMPQASS